MLEEELDQIKHKLVNSGYPESCILKNMREEPKETLILMAAKEILYMQLPFKEVGVCELLVRRLGNAIARTFPATTLRASFASRPLISTNPKDKPLSLSLSLLTYSFMCCCPVSCADETIWQLSQRLKEHKAA